MATTVYIYSSKSSPALQREGRDGLEDDLDEFLAGAGEVTGGGSSIRDRGWNVDLGLTDDANLEDWLARTVDFLKRWGVPDDTYLEIFPEDWQEGDKPRRIDVFPEQ